MNKEEYRRQNEAFMAQKAQQEGIRDLGGGVLAEVIETGEGRGGVTPASVVTCHYRGSLVSGRVFDDSWERGVPEAFRVRDLIEGFKTALCAMRIGDHWRVFIPWQQGYGKRGDSEIPGCSTLIFEILLTGIA